MERPLPHPVVGESLRLASEKDVPQIILFYRDNAAHFETVASQACRILHNRILD